MSLDDHIWCIFTQSQKFSFQFMKVLLIEMSFNMVLGSTYLIFNFFLNIFFITKCAFIGSLHFVEYFCVDRCE